MILNLSKLFFLGLITQTFAQYQPMLSGNNQWHFTTCNFGCIKDVYYTNGDTLVNGLNHKILDGYHFQSRTFLLRENLSAKKVYLTKINPSNVKEYLLYDFSLSEGDTFNMKNPVSPFPLHGGEFILDSIRMKPLNNNILYKHFYFSPNDNNLVSNHKVVWIEGIGSKSLINAPGGEENINGVGQLSCFFKNSTLIYSELNVVFDCNFQTLNSTQITKSFKKLNLHLTNKKNNYVFDNAESVYAISLINIFGKKVREIEFEQNKKIELDLTDFSTGIYILSVNNGNFKCNNFKIIIN